MRGAVVSIQVAVLLVFILAIAVALAGYLYTTFYSSLQYTYIALTQAYIYPTPSGAEVKICFSVGGSGGLTITGVELDGRPAASFKVYVRGAEAGEVRAGDVGYIKADFPGVVVRPGWMPTGRVVTRQGFSFLFTPSVSQAEGRCPGE
ncbi:hypothetical protein [Pyrobaculum aerophilum]|uniref:Conserved within P. aerophilum n=3 Tax=Pyrobaculum aerophilum TaxID=13773 RepID=Q8ZY06_PYRAE|nr:hypothetical protein [Pyrobaculum aerophilum]AAL63190.1 conserved within P. aerophilum [Pyrobaculum aerophilum str. IM2]MCX8136183.1 hypothetical protein [Pyrobaculum aerophilum]RFA98490.1 hypothetical protein CGL51_00135 [Pyrobaculum aerophilum]HII48049.1 hypothetical protein [Pyrobaculum aerophilum]